MSIDESKARELIAECRDHINAMRLNSANRSLDELEAALAESGARQALGTCETGDGKIPHTLRAYCKNWKLLAQPTTAKEKEVDFGTPEEVIKGLEAINTHNDALAKAGETSAEWDARATDAAIAIVREGVHLSNPKRREQFFTRKGWLAGYAAGRAASGGQPLEHSLRQFLWLNHRHTNGLYGDDGEMQCGECRVDYKRDELQVCIEAANASVIAIGLKKLAAPAAAPELSEEQKDWIATLRRYPRDHNRCLDVFDALLRSKGAGGQ